MMLLGTRWLLLSNALATTPPTTTSPDEPFIHQGQVHHAERLPEGASSPSPGESGNRGGTSETMLTGEASLTAGGGYDTNVNRHFNDQARGDHLTHLHLRSDLTLRRGSLSAALNADNALRFFPRENSHGFYAGAGSLSLTARTTPWLTLGADLDIKERAERESLLDYRHSGASARMALLLTRNLRLTFRGGYRHMVFKPHPQLNNHGEAFSTGILTHLDPGEVSLLFSTARRRFSSPRLLAGETPTMDPQGTRREDRHSIVSLNYRYSGRHLLQMGAFGARNNSNSVASGFHRIGMSAGVGTVLPLGLLIASKATVQHTVLDSNLDEVDDPLVYYLDEDTYSSAVIRMSKPIMDNLTLEGRISHYFTIGSEPFRRSVIFTGLCYEIF